MTIAAPPTQSVRRMSLRGGRRPRPGSWILWMAGLAWIGLVMWSVIGTGAVPAGCAGHHHGHATAGQQTPNEGLIGLTTVHWAAMWVLMVIAMMWPLYSAAVHAVSQASFRRWRASTVAAYLISLTALWLFTGLTGYAIYALVKPVLPAWIWSVAWLAVGFVSLNTLWRRRFLSKCGRRSGAVAACGARAVVSAAHAGARAWPRCAVLCGPVMLAMVSSHVLVVMVAGSLTVWWEQRHPRAWRDPVPAVLLGATAVLVIVIAHWEGAPEWLAPKHA